MLSSAFLSIALLSSSSSSDLRYVDEVLIGQKPYLRIEGRVNEFTFSDQYEASLAENPKGGFAVAWESRRQLDGKPGVFYRAFDNIGTPLTTETRLSSHNIFPESRPSISFDTNGKPVVVFESLYRDGSLTGIFKGDKQVNVSTKGEQFLANIASDSRGRHCIVWSSEIARAQTRLFCRIIDKDGNATNEFQVSNITSGNQTLSSITILDGHAIVVWQQFNRQGQPEGLFAQKISMLGWTVGETKKIADSNAIEPVVSSYDGGLIVGWCELTEDGSTRVRAQRFDSEWNAIGNVISPEMKSGDQNAVALSARKDGSFVISWNERTDKQNNIFMRVYDANGNPETQPFIVTKHTEGKQSLAEATGRNRISFSHDGTINLVWNGEAGLGDGRGVHFTRFIPMELVSTEDYSRLMEISDKTFANLNQSESSFNNDKPVQVSVVTEVANPHEPPVFDPRLREDPWGDYGIEPRSGGFLGIVNTGWTPPDPHVAVGPNHFVAMTNGAIAGFNKDGTKTFQYLIEGSTGFWGSLNAGGFVFDPEAIYDPHSGQFFAMACERTGGQSYFLVAVTTSGNPNGTWHKYRFNVSGLVTGDIDSPNIAVDKDVVYLSADMYGSGTRYFIMNMKKSDLLAGNSNPLFKTMTINSTIAWGFPITWDTNTPAQYMIQHHTSSNNTTVTLHAIQDPLGSPTRVTYSLTVPSYSPPEDPPQQGTSVKIETFDARFWSCVYRDGSLWATHHVNSSRVRARWYEIKMNNWPTSGQNPTLVQSGEVDFGGTIRTFFSSISVNAYGQAGVVAVRSSPTEYISIVSATRNANDPLGSMPVTEIVKSNTAPYTTAGRYGDYSACVTDPSDNKLWGHHEWAEGSSWRTWIFPLLVGTTVEELLIQSIVPIFSGGLTGDINEISASDNNYLIVPPGLLSRNSKTASIVDYITTTSQSNLQGLDLRLEMKSAPSVSEAHIYLLNHQSGEYDLVKTNIVGLTDTVINVDNIQDHMNYVHPTSGQIRIRVELKITLSTRNGPTAYMDEVKVIIRY